MREEALPAGKVPTEVLERVVFSRLGWRRPETLLRPGIGLDCAVLNFGRSSIALTSDPITAAGRNAGWLAVHVACNDLAACGSEPIGILVTILLPVGSTESSLAAICEDLHRAASSLKVEILGGHSEVALSVRQPIIISTAIGRVVRGNPLAANGCKPGDTLLMTKAAGLEGTAILAADFAERLVEIVEPGLLTRARAFLNEISVVAEGLAAARSGATGLHDATEGGVIGAAWEMATAAGLGLIVYSERVPVRPETLAICSALNVDPLRLISSGSMLIATPSPQRTIRAVQKRGVLITEIGKFNESGDRVLVGAGGASPLEPPARDELWRVLEGAQ